MENEEIKSETIYSFTPAKLKSWLLKELQHENSIGAELKFEIKEIGGTSYQQGESFPVPTVVGIKLIVKQ